MVLESITRYAKMKGVKLLGTGDFTHPSWLSELANKLTPYDEGIFLFNEIYFVLSGEISLVYEKGGKVRRVHLMVFAPDFETVFLFNEIISKYTDLNKDGRPIIKGITCPEFLDKAESVSKEIFVVSAHIWTPWYSVLGSKSGFDSIEECFEDKSGSIFALETGLSSDPPMNWRVSSLDRYTLISNSDAHSCSNIGREVNCFDLKKLTYKSIFNAVRYRKKDDFRFTVEVNPAFGKYHLSGHRKCGYFAYLRELKEKRNLCPICGKK